MVNTPDLIASYSLSLEELTLSLGLLNLRDMANILIRSIYPELTEAQMKSRLISATHSLLAQGWIEISENRKPRLGPGLESAIAPMATYNSLMQLINNTSGKTKRSTIYIQSGKSFTSQTSDRGVMQKIDHGDIRSLGGYIQMYFPDFGKETHTPEIGRTPAGLLDHKEKKGDDSVEAILKANGWKPSDIKSFCGDLEGSFYQGIIVLKKATYKMTVEEARDAPQHSIALIQSKKHSWFIDHPQNSHKLGMAHLASRKFFEEKLAELLAE